MDFHHWGLRTVTREECVTALWGTDFPFCGEYCFCLSHGLSVTAPWWEHEEIVRSINLNKCKYEPKMWKKYLDLRWISFEQTAQLNSHLCSQPSNSSHWKRKLFTSLLSGCPSFLFLVLVVPHVNSCIEGGWSHWCDLSQINYLANASLSSPVKTVAHNFSI